MSLETKSLDELRELAYRKRLIVNRLENELYDPENAGAVDDHATRFATSAIVAHFQQMSNRWIRSAS